MSVPLGRALLATLLATPAHAQEIIVIAGREPVPLTLAGASATILDRDTIDALALPLAAGLIRLTPSAAIASAGGPGQQTQLRLRGSEANHTLLFIDGIEVNDPAASSEYRLETLATQGLERIEILRGPQSALWGAEAIGGVVSVTTSVPAAPLLSARVETGGLDTHRAGLTAGTGGARGGVAATAGWQASDGVDVSATPGGDRDGYDNLTLALKAILTPTPHGELGLAARYTSATSRFDDFGFDGRPADARLATGVETLALRVHAEARPTEALTLGIAGTWLDTRNRNRRDGQFTNASDGRRFKLTGQTSYRFATGPAAHRLTAAAEHEAQGFTARDTGFGGLSNQRRQRETTSAIAEYRLDLAERAALSLSARHDANDRFADATTLRAAAAIALPAGFTAHAGYGEGVADPTFFDLFGFFPGFFAGNPDLVPERANGWDAGAGWRRGALSLDVTYYRADLRREIVGTFDPATFLSGVANARGRSRRQGVEVTAEARPAAWLRLAANYAWLDAAEPATTGGPRVREVRRPEHSAALTAIATLPRAELAASLAHVGERRDTDFGTFTRVTLEAYTLASLSARYRLTRRLALTARAENAFDARTEDVLGYSAPGATLHAGVAVTLD